MSSLSRRGFLRNAALTGVAASAVSCNRTTSRRSDAPAQSGSSQRDTFERFLSLLDGNAQCDVPETSLSTHDSWVGLVKTDRLGLEALHLFYGRKPALLSPNILTFDVSYKPEAQGKAKVTQKHSPLCIEENDGLGIRGVAAFLAMDILCYHLSIEDASYVTSATAVLHLPPTNPAYARQVRYDSASNQITITTRVPRTDKRDPNIGHLLTLVLKLPKEITVTDTPAQASDTTLTLRFDIKPLAVGEYTFTLGIGEGEEAESIVKRMAAIGNPTAADTKNASREWLRRGLGRFTFEGVPEHLHRHYAMSAYQLLANTKAPRGRLQHRSFFPSRGTYCSHYLWDACFSSMGVAQFNDTLAAEYMLNLCENQEPDGKIPQFICSNWNRPGDSQPPVIAWATWRLYEQFQNRALLEQVYEPLGRMVDWWFANRDDDHDGLVEYLGRLEAGWDNSPRFEKGRIAGVDLNAYLNREMFILSRMATVLGRPEQSSEWLARRNRHAKHMLERLFDPQEQMFFDRLVEQNTLYRLKTPACFAPLATGVPVDAKIAKSMIERHLLNPAEFFGPYPFPVVAYDEPTYAHADWWRGPVWVNIAWLMTEALRLHGFEQARREAISRLIAMMTRDLSIAELYDSQTGQPEGCRGYGWTCALLMEMSRNP